jgi:hypothetical protein
MPSVAGVIRNYLQLGLARIYLDSSPPGDRFIANSGKNLPVRRVSNSQYQYISPIAHQLAATSSLTPLTIAQTLWECLPPELTSSSPQMEMQYWYTDKAYLCFQFTPRSIATWLDYIYTETPAPIAIGWQDRPNVDLSILVYTHARCQAVLKLAQTEGLITKDLDAWYIPRSIWFDRDSDRCDNRFKPEIMVNLEEITEGRLIHALMDVLDGIGSLDPGLTRSVINLAQSWLEFHRHCRIFGDVKRQNPHLAIARCGLTAIVERLLVGGRE